MTAPPRRRPGTRRPLRGATPGSRLATVTDIRRYSQPIGLGFYLTHPGWLAEDVGWWLRPGGPAWRWLASARMLGATVKWHG